jgi:hypothetical protein
MSWSWSSGLSPRPPLDPEFIWRKGSAGYAAQDERAGRAAEDVADFRLRLEMLCEAARQEANLTALGHAMAYGQLKAAVRTRHALGRLWRRRPELPQTPLAPPIIVVGQMRSGTTRLHRLLAADPRHCGTRLCNSIEPAPRTPDTRALRCAAVLALGRRINPWLDTLHPFGATRADEELGWLAAALNHGAIEAQAPVPSFVAFSETRDPAPVYREFARILRTDAAVMGNAGRPRVLKCPQFAEDLPALLNQFPDARVIASRRDSGEVLASSVSVVAGTMAYMTGAASIETIEREWQRKLALRKARMSEALANFAGPLAQVQFTGLNRDWRGEMKQVYAALGLDLNDPALAAMGAEQAKAERSAHHLHAGTYRQFARA